MGRTREARGAGEEEREEMTEVFTGETLVPSYSPSPRPRRQPMTPLSTNQRSYSRMSSKGVLGDESPLLLSPLPKYPNRRRSITFADETEATVREERPHYTMWEAGTTPNVKSSESPTRWPILKPATNNCCDDISPAAKNQQHSVSITTTAALAKSPTPKRGRSNSRQRRVARRKEAELHHGFYDDSFVEEYVLKAKKDIEGEETTEEKGPLEEELKQDEEKGAETEDRGGSAALRINTLKQVKEYLLSTANIRRSSLACSSPDHRDGSVASRLRRQTPKKELDLLQKIDEEIEEMERVGEIVQQRTVKSAKCSVPLVTHVDEMDDNGSRKRARQPSLKKRGRSGNTAQGLGMNTHCDDDDDYNSNEEDNVAKLRNAKLERIIARVIKQQAKRHRGKRSVVVIDWDCAESDELLAEVEEEEEDEGDKMIDNGDDDERVVKATRLAPPNRKEMPVKKSVEVSRVEVKAPASKQRKPQTATRSVSVCDISTRRRKGASVSVAPDLGEDSLLLEEDQPVLLRRCTTKRPVPTRSISYVSAGAEDDSVFEPLADVSRKPPRRVPAPKATRRGRKPSAASGVAPSLSLPSGSPPTASALTAAASCSFASARQDMYADVETPAPVPLQDTMRRRRRTTAAALNQSAPAVSADDPMAVFFGASFPSPSKFEEMMLAAGGVPEVRRAGRGQMRQPALLLPDTISRRR